LILGYCRRRGGWGIEIVRPRAASLSATRASPELRGA
jgi:hypothetical protein